MNTTPTTTVPNVAAPAGTTPDAQSSADGLVQCGNCGRYVWHTTERCPDVAPPAGATPDVWEGNPAQRVVAGTNRAIDGHDVLVWTPAVQYADGSLREPAEVHVELSHDDAMTADQARVLAAELIAAADEIDRW